MTGGQLFHVEQSAKTSDDYLTPKWVFETLGLEFDLDVAAPPWDTHVPARRKFTKADDGLLQPWHGRVWMNPPYSKASPWVRKFIVHGHGIALLPGGSIFMSVMFAAFGDECEEAIRRLGPTRTLEARTNG